MESIRRGSRGHEVLLVEGGMAKDLFYQVVENYDPQLRVTIIATLPLSRLQCGL